MVDPKKAALRNERTPEQSSEVSFVLLGMDCMRVHTRLDLRKKSEAELRGIRNLQLTP